jgi:hypothetical protein
MTLFFSPGLFGFSASAPWQTTSPTIGLLVALLSMTALAAFAVWEEQLNLIARAVPCPIAPVTRFSE